MKENTQNSKQSQETETVLPLQEAVNKVQQLRIANDPQNQIINIFRTIQDTTENLKDIEDLPTLNTISKLLNLSTKFTLNCLNELIGLGKYNHYPLIFANPILEPVSGLDPSEKPFAKTAYIRPGFKEGSSIINYTTKLQHHNLSVIREWAEARADRSEQELSLLIEKAIEEETSLGTLLQKEIAYFFFTDKENTSEKQKKIYTKFVAPVIDDLIKNTNISFIQKTLQTKIIKTMHWNKIEEIKIMYKILMDKFFSYEDHSNTLLQFQEPTDTITKIQDFPLSTLENQQRQIIEEVYLLCHFLPRNLPLNTLRDIPLEELEKINIRPILKIIEENYGMIEREKLELTYKEDEELSKVDKVLSSKYLINNMPKKYYLHVNQILKALDIAKKNVENYSDYTQINILSALKIHNFLDRANIQDFYYLENKAVYKGLPWYLKIIRFLLHKKRLSPFELKKYTAIQQNQMQRRLLKIEHLTDTSYISKEDRKTIKMNVVDEGSQNTITTNKVTLEDAPISPVTNEEEEILDIKLQHIIHKIINLLDQAWDKEIYPNRLYLLKNLAEMESEEKLVSFIKKYASKDIYSFTIKSQKSEYNWPILISRRYLIKKGAKLQKKIEESIKNLQNAVLPDQNSYDILNSVESFLSRTLYKIKQ